MQEGVVEILTLKGWHAAIFSCLSIEDHIDGKEGSAEDAGAVKQALSDIALSHRVVGGLLIAAAKCLSELGYILRCRDGGRFGVKVGTRKLLPERGVVESADGEGLR